MRRGFFGLGASHTPANECKADPAPPEEEYNPQEELPHNRRRLPKRVRALA